MRRISVPVIAAVVLYLALSLFGFVSATRQTEGKIVYTIDDPYIHMAIARNLAEFGVWGVNHDSFDSASSSILWTLLLSGVYTTFGSSESAPLVLNLVFGILILILSGVILENAYLRRRSMLFILSGVILFTPLTAVTFTGMEHILHLLTAITFVWIVSRLIVDAKPGPMSIALSGLSVFMMVGVRYEGLFLAGIAVLLLLYKRKYLPAAVILVMSLLPVTLYGIYSVAHGGCFLPNSVLLKGAVDIHSIRGILFFFYYAFRQLYESPHLLILLVIIAGNLAVNYNAGKLLHQRVTIMQILFVAATVLHLMFARTGWFYRYEAYLVGLGILSVGLDFNMIGNSFKRLTNGKAVSRLLAIAFTVILLAPFLFRFAQSSLRIKQASRNICEQQYQMGLFVEKYFNHAGVAAHDIGALCWRADIRLLDLFGLAGFAVAESKREGIYDAGRVARLADSLDIDIAIVHDNWFNRDDMGAPPPGWQKVGSWRITQNKISAGDIVSFYAVKPSEKDSLVNALRLFSNELPERVIQSGSYMNH